MDKQSEWNRGFKDGMAFAEQYFFNGFYTKEWPKNWGNGYYGGGYAEGQITGRSKSFVRDFPGMIEFSPNVRAGSATVTFQDGRKIIVTPQ